MTATSSFPSNRRRRLDRWSLARLLFTLAGCVLLWTVVAGASLLVGSNGEVGIPPNTQIRALRIEVVLVSSLVGACLAGAGVVYQAILRNPLADPYLLGVSGGASLLAYAWRIPLAGLLGGSVFAAMSQQTFAFAGALSVVAIVLLLSTRRGRLEPVTLLLVGVIMNAINGAIFLLLNALYPQAVEGLGGMIGFLVGGIQSNLSRSQEYTAAIIAAAGWIVLLYFAGQLNVAALSEAEAEALGVRIHRLRWIGLIVASIVTAAAVSISGPIGFVGLICPHIVRRIMGSDHRRLLPWSTALGAALLCVADAVSRMLIANRHVRTQLPVGVLTALLGGPFFLMLLWERRSSGE